MTRFYVDDAQRTDFSLPVDDPVGQLTGGNTEHTYHVKLGRGQWTYTVTCESAKNNGRGRLRFKIKTGSYWIEQRQKISAGSTLSNSFCVTHDELELKFIFSRGTGTTGVRYTCQITGPVATESCPIDGDEPPDLPHFWFWGRW